MKHATTEAVLQRTRGRRLLLCSVALLAGGTLHAIKANTQEAALGGRVHYAITSDGATGFSLGGFYAPDILTTGDVDNVRDVHARLEQRVTNGFDVFVGYRMFEWDMGGFGQDTRRVDDGWQLGLRGTF